MRSKLQQSRWQGITAVVSEADSLRHVRYEFMSIRNLKIWSEKYMVESEALAKLLVSGKRSQNRVHVSESHL